MTLKSWLVSIVMSTTLAFGCVKSGVSQNITHTYKDNLIAVLEQPINTINVPTIQNKNYRIDSSLSRDEKLESWRQEKEEGIYDRWVLKEKILLLKKELDSTAFVREYPKTKSIPEHLWGEQIFNRYAVIYLWLQDSLPSWNQYIEMWFGWENQQQLVDKYFKQWDTYIFPGFYEKWFAWIGTRATSRLRKGHIILDRDHFWLITDQKETGYSIRLLKQ